MLVTMALVDSSAVRIIDMIIGSLLVSTGYKIAKEFHRLINVRVRLLRSPMVLYL